MFTACVVVICCYVGFDIVIADTAVVTVTSFGFKTDGTAAFTKEHSFGFATAANVAIVEAFATVLAEMRVIVAVLNAKRGRIHTIGVALTAVKTKLTNLAHLDLAESISAIGAKMLVPFGALDAVFTAGASLRFRIVHTAIYTETAIVAKIDSVLIQTFLALLTDDTAFLAVIISVETLRV